MLEIGLGSFYLSEEPARKHSPARFEDSAGKNSQPDRPRVLVVDDEKLIADTCAEILEISGYHARTAHDGWSALEIMAEFQPDYVLTDVLMPGMNGMELGIAVSRMSPQTRVLLFSGQAGISDILLEGHRQGYQFELIAKPIHPDKLIEYFRKLKR